MLINNEGAIMKGYWISDVCCEVFPSRQKEYCYICILNTAFHSFHPPVSSLEAMPFFYPKPKEDTWTLASLWVFRFSPQLNHSSCFYDISCPKEPAKNPTHILIMLSIATSFSWERSSTVLSCFSSPRKQLKRWTLSPFLHHIRSLLAPTQNWSS